MKKTVTLKIPFTQSISKINLKLNETPRRRAAGYLKGIIFIY